MQLNTNRLHAAYGVFRVGNQVYAVDTLFLREVIPSCPLEPAPQSDPGLLGYIAVRKQCIPVIDLQTLPGFEKHQSSDAPSLYVIVSYQQRELAIAAHAVFDVMRASKENLTEFGGVEHDEFKGLIEGSLDGLGTLKNMVFVLSVQDLHRRFASLLTTLAKKNAVNMEVDESPIESESLPQDEEDVLFSEANLAKNPLILVEVGSSRLAFFSSQIYTTAQVNKLEADLLNSGYYLGMFDHYEKRVPLIDLGAFLRLSSLKNSAPFQVVIVKTEAGDLGLRVDSLLELSRHSVHARFRIHAQAHPLLVQSLQFDAQSSQRVLMVDIQALVKTPELLGLAKTGSQLTAQLNRQQSVQGKHAQRVDPFQVISFVAGGHAAIEMACIEEIVTLQAVGAMTLQEEDGRLHLCRNGEMFPVLNMANLLGNQTEASHDQFAFVVRVENKQYALSVQHIEAIQTADWKPIAPGFSKNHQLKTGESACRHLTEIQDETGQNHVVRLVGQGDIQMFVGCV